MGWVSGLEPVLSVQASELALFSKPVGVLLAVDFAEPLSRLWRQKSRRTNPEYARTLCPFVLYLRRAKAPNLAPGRATWDPTECCPRQERAPRWPRHCMLARRSTSARSSASIRMNPSRGCSISRMT